jgi:hypothetical protein
MSEQVTLKGAAEIIRTQLKAAQAAGRLPACLRFRVRATRGGKVNVEVAGHDRLIGRVDGVIDNQDATRWFQGDGKRLLDAVDHLARGMFKPPPAGETTFGMLMLSVTAGPVRTIRMD